MGIKAEYNPDLALRDIAEFKEGRRKEDECIPEKLEVGHTYSFLKRDQRLYWLHGEIPLVKTEGGEKLSFPVASVVILNATHSLIDGEVWTTGEYKVVEIIDESKIRFNGFSKII